MKYLLPYICPISGKMLYLKQRLIEVCDADFHWLAIGLIGLSLNLQGLYSSTKYADNILGRFIIILQTKLQE